MILDCLARLKATGLKCFITFNPEYVIVKKRLKVEKTAESHKLVWGTFLNNLIYLNLINVNVIIHIYNL